MSEITREPRDTSPPRHELRNLGIVLILLLALSLSLVLTVGAAFRAGSVGIVVRESDGTDIALRIPAVVVHAAIVLAPSEVWDELAAEAHGWLPVVAATHRELAKLPDCTLIEVIDDEEWVRIGKRDGRIVVEVETWDEEIRIAVPLKTVSVALSRIARAA